MPSLPYGGLKSKVGRIIGNGFGRNLALLGLTLSQRHVDPLCILASVPLSRLVSGTIQYGVIPNANNLCIDQLMNVFRRRAGELARQQGDIQICD